MRKPDSIFLTQFFQLFVPVVLLLGMGVGYVGQARIDAEFSLIFSHQKLVAGVSANRLQSQLQTVKQHIRALAEESDVRRAIDNDDPDANTAMASAFKSLLSRNANYDEVRWLDQTGMERVRINKVNGRAFRVPENALQNKDQRYYFKESMALQTGEIYFSPLDLNVENGRIEIPFKPMLRVALPVYNKQQQARGILIINVAVQSILDTFDTENEKGQTQLMLLNRQGDWLKSPNQEDEWGFMFNRETTLRSRHPQLWAKISTTKSGQIETKAGLWSWQTVDFLAQDKNRDLARSPYLFVLHLLPTDKLESIRYRSWVEIGRFAILVLLMFGIFITRLIMVREKQRKADIATATEQAKSAILHKQIDAQKRFQHVVEASVNGILVVDNEGKIVLANLALTDMFGYTHDELVNQPLEKLLPDRMRNKHMQLRQEYMQHPSKRSMGLGRELSGKRRDGSLFPIEVGLSTYTDEEEIYVLATVVDISERNQLLAVKERLASIISSTEDAIISKTLDGIITSWNPAAERLFGYREEEMIGQSINLLLPPGQEKEEQALLDRLARGETIAQYDTVRRCKDGRLVEISNTMSPLRDVGGHIIGASKIARDISQIKHAQNRIKKLNDSLERQVKELAVANKELDSFAYAVSHDLRAPLRAMSGFTVALLEDYGDRLDDEGRSYLIEIDLACKRMWDLIDGILTLSRSTRGELRLDRLDLSSMARRIRDELVCVEPAREVKWEIAPGLFAWGDSRLIENVLRNLIGNAWKYTVGSHHAMIRVYAEETEGQSWFCVSDTGVGFDMRHSDKLYKPFQRLHRQDEFPGLGIGLATVQRIIHRHQGQLKSMAEPGKGAMFAFTLPKTLKTENEEAE